MLVGRDGELAALREALAAAIAGRMMVAARLVGEPGIGKTRLLSELQALALGAGYLVLHGGAAEFERDEPFGVFVRALDDHVAAHMGQLVRRLGTPAVGELAAILPGLEERGVAPARGLVGERYRAHREVRSLLSALAADRPLVLLLDDLHWADEASLELLGALTRRPPAGRVLLVAAYRPRQASRRLLDALKDPVTAIELGPLDHAAARVLLGPDCDAEAAAGMYRESGGVPLYLEQLAGARRRGLGERGERRETVEVPAAVAVALAAELDALSPGARVFLQGASVAGDPFDPALAAAAARIPPTDGLVLIDELAARDLVRETAQPRLLRFRHPIIRRAVYESLGPGWRLGAHARVARALRDAGAPLTARAHHVAVAASPGDRDAVALLLDAAHAAVTRAPATAARWLEAALRLIGESAADERLAVLVALARSLAATGSLGDARSRLEQALVLARAAGIPHVQLTAALARVEMLDGAPGAARARLLAALNEQASGMSADTAALCIELAASASAWGAGQWSEVLEFATRARAIALDVNDDPLVLAACALQATGHLGLGRLSDALPALQAAAAALDALPDDALAPRLEGAFYLARAALWAGRPADVVRFSERGLTAARRSGHSGLIAPLMINQILANVVLGRLASADELSQACVEAARLGNQPLFQAWALHARCWTCMYAGDVRRALAAGRESIEILRSLGPEAPDGGAMFTIGATLVEAGEPAQAIQLAHELRVSSELPHHAPAVSCATFEVLTRAAIATGDHCAAADWAARAEHAAEGLGDGLYASLAHRARAEVGLANGSPEIAAAAALDAAACAERSSAHIEVARAQVLAGRALAAQGQRQAGLALLERAAGELDACGAHHFRNQAARELRALGRHVTRAPAPTTRRRTASTLTPREAQIAELVTSGRTNKQIAQTLHITENTVETHLRKIYAKLEINKRAALAGALADRRLDVATA